MSPQFDPRAIPELSPQEKRLQRILKGVVVVLTLLILIVLGFMIYKMISPKKKTAVPVAVTETIPPAAASPSGALFGKAEVRIPHGAEVIEVISGPGNLVVRLRTATGEEQILVLDTQSGQERGRFVLKPSS